MSNLYSRYVGRADERQTRVLALIAATIGIASAVAFLGWFGFNSAVGIPLGVLALGDLRSQEAPGVRALAVVSIVLGILSLGLVVIAAVNDAVSVGAGIVFWLYLAVISTVGWLVIRGVVRLVWAVGATHRARQRSSVDRLSK
jgi:hypothetical protein